MFDSVFADNHNEMDDIWMRLCTSKVNPRCKKSSTEGNESRKVAAKAEIVKPTQLQDLNKMNKLIWHRSNREMLESIRVADFCLRQFHL